MGRLGKQGALELLHELIHLQSTKPIALLLLEVAAEVDGL